MHVTKTEVVKQVCEYYDVNFSQLRSKNRHRGMVLARQVAMYLCCRLTPDSLPEIGRAFAKHHTTVLAARDRVHHQLATDEALAADVATLRSLIRQRQSAGVWS